MKRDVKNIFHNKNEFAEEVEVYYNQTTYHLNIIIDTSGSKQRKITNADNVEGLMLSDATVYINYADIKLLPKRGRVIEIDSIQYNIAKSSLEEDEIILELEMFDE